jgi:hypothetical protein
LEAIVEKSVGQIGFIGHSYFRGFGDRGLYIDGDKPTKHLRTGGGSLSV